MPVQPAKVQTVDLHGDIAWVEVIEEQPHSDAPPVRKVRFYRQTDLGWKHTAPRVEFWKTAIRVQYGKLFVQYHKRDTPDVVFLEELIATTFVNVCATTLCPAVNTLTVDFSVELPVYRFPYLEAAQGYEGGDRLVLSSPWLSGLPVEGGWDEDYLEELTHAVAYAVTARSMRSTTRRELSPLRDAVADEYAAWYAQGRTDRLPLLGPIIERQGAQVVPGLLRSAKESLTTDQFLSRWLGLSLEAGERDPVRIRAYFEALLNLERQALLAGRKKTFLMLQDTTWQGAQERYYAQAQSGEVSLPRSPVRVQSVQILESHAQIEVEEPIPAMQGQPPQSFRNTVYFRLEDGDWRHANSLEAYLEMLRPTPTPAPSPSSTPTPGGEENSRSSTPHWSTSPSTLSSPMG